MPSLTEPPPTPSLSEPPPPNSRYETAPRRLDPEKTSGLPTPDQGVAHLRLLEAIYRLRQQVEDGVDYDASSASDTTAAKEKRWALYITKAVLRFYRWWGQCDIGSYGKQSVASLVKLSKWWVRGKGLQVDEKNMPPLGMCILLSQRMRLIWG